MENKTIATETEESLAIASKDMLSESVVKNTIKETDINQPNSIAYLLVKPSELPFFPFTYKMFSIAFPGMFFYLTLLLLQTVNLAFIGQKYNDDDMINAIGISNLYLNCTLMSIYMGLVSGIETLCANAYATKQYKLMGYYYQRARIVGYFVTIVIVIFHLCTIQYILGLFSLNDQVITYSSHYVYSILIYVFFDVQTACVFRMLNVLEKSHINFFILLISLILHPLWNYIFIYVLDYNVVGAGISFTISKMLTCVLATLYLWFYHPVPEANFWINKECFKWDGIKNYLKFSMGLAFVTCAEWWACELQAIIAINIGEKAYTVYVLIAELAALLYSIDVGFMLAITILISEIIAKGSIAQLRKSFVYSLVFGLFCGGIYMTVFFIFREHIFRLFLDDKEVFELAEPALWLLPITEFFDLFQTCLVSMFRGIGRQYLASGLMFVHCYIIMISLSYLFGIVFKLNVFGMYLGMGISDCFMSIVYMIVLSVMDLGKTKKETLKRIEEDSKLSQE